jgi:LysR family transcriptional regulator, glycine cleavage system transcriptional activator
VADLGSETDVAVRFGSGRWSGTRANLLFAESIFPVAAPAIAKRLARRPLGDLLKECLIHDSDGSDWRAWLRAAGIKGAPAGLERRFVDHDMALQAAQLGLGVALARAPLVHRALENKSLVRLSGPTLESERAHYVVTRPDEDRKPVLRLVERLRASARTRA